MDEHNCLDCMFSCVTRAKGSEFVHTDYRGIKTTHTIEVDAPPVPDGYGKPQYGFQSASPHVWLDFDGTWREDNKNSPDKTWHAYKITDADRIAELKAVNAKLAKALRGIGYSLNNIENVDAIRSINKSLDGVDALIKKEVP